MVQIEKAINNEHSELIQKLIRARKLSGLTQQELADKVGIKQSQLARIESMKSCPQLNTLVQIVNAMNCKLIIIENDKETN